MRAPLLLLVVLSGCTYEPVPTLTAPTQSTATITPAPSPPPTVDPPAPPALVITGPSGCIEARTAPRVLTWTIAHLPPQPRVQKAYAHDDEASCRPTLGELRTQNDHLRVVGDRVEFDRDTFSCGRAQVDVDINGALVIGVVVRYPADCVPPPPPPPPPPPKPCKKTGGSRCR